MRWLECVSASVSEYRPTLLSSISSCLCILCGTVKQKQKQIQTLVNTHTLTHSHTHTHTHMQPLSMEKKEKSKRFREHLMYCIKGKGKRRLSAVICRVHSPIIRNLVFGCGPSCLVFTAGYFLFYGSGLVRLCLFSAGFIT